MFLFLDNPNNKPVKYPALVFLQEFFQLHDLTLNVFWNSPDLIIQTDGTNPRVSMKEEPTIAHRHVVRPSLTKSALKK